MAFTAADKRKAYRRVFKALLKRFGPRRWWPAKTRFEVMVGAVLTQNTSWANAARAVAALRQAGLMSYAALAVTPSGRIARLIRPALYYNTKSRYLKNLMVFMRDNGGGSLKRMFRTDATELRRRLLAVKGVGEETADSILLYAGDVPSFVVDAYTRRIYSRLGLIGGGEKYAWIKAEFEANLPRDVYIYNEYHALITTFGHRVCKSRPLCEECPLKIDKMLRRQLKPLKGCLGR